MQELNVALNEPWLQSSPFLRTKQEQELTQPQRICRPLKQRRISVLVPPNELGRDLTYAQTRDARRRNGSTGLQCEWRSRLWRRPVVRSDLDRRRCRLGELLDAVVRGLPPGGISLRANEFLPAERVFPRLSDRTRETPAEKIQAQRPRPVGRYGAQAINGRSNFPGKPRDQWSGVHAPACAERP
jgi:hypothetical protein